MEVKQSTAFKVPVRLRYQVDGSGATGLAYTAVTVYIQKQGGSSTAKTLTGTDWVEIDPTNFPGVYDLNLSSTDTNTLGYLKFSVVAPTIAANTFFGLVEIVANLESDTFSRLGAPVGASIAADIAAIQTDTTRLRKYQEGRWKIWTTSGGSGEAPNQLVLYDTDNTTVLIKFNLFDISGTATSTSPFERVKV